MKRTFRHLWITGLVAAAALLAAPGAEARRGPQPTTTTTERGPGYVPAATPGVSPTTVPFTFPDPGPFPAGPPFAPGPGPAPGSPPPARPDLRDDLPLGDAPHAGEGAPPSEPSRERGPSGLIDDVLSKTGAESRPLIRLGLAAMAFGVGLTFLTRRRTGGVTT